MPAERRADEAKFTLSQGSEQAVVEATPSPEMTMKQQFQEGPGEALRQKQAVLADELVNRQYLAHPELVGHHGSAAREEYVENIKYHLACLADAMNMGSPDLYNYYVAWAKIMLSKRGMPVEDLVQQLEATRMVVKDTLEGEAGALAMEYINSGLAHMPSMPTEVHTHLKATEPHAELAREYLNALLKGEHLLASRNIFQAIGKGVTIKEIYLHVLQPVQYEVGRLWQLNELSVAQEHYCTSATQRIMSQLYSQVFTPPKRIGTMVATCVAGDAHEVGLRMVADFFEMAGWNTFYLGANLPAKAVIEIVVQRKAHLLCISATHSFHLRSVRDLIQGVRADSACRNVKIIVGGSPFWIAPNLWRTVDSDGCASNAQEALILANQLIARAS